MISNYALQVLTHGWQRPLMLRDGDYSIREIDALVKSGDYFLTMATRVDMVASTLQAQHNSESETLETIVADLIYLHHNYKIQPLTNNDQF